MPSFIATAISIRVTHLCNVCALCFSFLLLRYASSFPSFIHTFSKSSPKTLHSTLRFKAHEYALNRYFSASPLPHTKLRHPTPTYMHTFFLSFYLSPVKIYDRVKGSNGDVCCPRCCCRRHVFSGYLSSMLVLDVRLFASSRTSCGCTAS